MLYAKSEPKQSIKEHTQQLLENMQILKKLYEEDILKNKYFKKEFWELLQIICRYHDIGKVYIPFQNMILEKLGQEKIQTKFSYSNIKHEQISPLFVPVEDFTRNQKKLIYQSIYYHHEREQDEVSKELVEEIIKKDILPRLDEIEIETDCKINKELKSTYLGYVGNRKRISEFSDLYIEYCLLKGLLHRLDYSSSAGIKIEDDTKDNLSEYTKQFIIKEHHNLNELQEFCSDNQSNNILVIGSTGIGKTEAATIWSGNSKTFFTLPIRVSINAIYDRIKNLINYKHVGLLHSSALEYLERNELEFQYENYEQSKNLYQKVTTCTIDQIFPFVFKYKGYEKIYATLSYSKIIVDEIQAYSPEITAILLKGIQMINNIGGRFMIMTATLPGIYKEELQNMGIKFKYNKFLKNIERHRINIKNDEIQEDYENILERAKYSKVLIILNTINKANELYNKLIEKGAKNIQLLHSRFIQQDRNKKENEIKQFSKDRNLKGIWITTQIVEASLDIDFDYLYTEMSTLDSLFQRLGRCYRNREYLEKQPNIFVYTKNTSGIKYVYDEDIYEKSLELLKEYDNEILTENIKVDLVDKLYSKEMISNTKFYKKFKTGLEILENISQYDINKSEAQKLLRKIENITVIPKDIYDSNLDLFSVYESATRKNNYEEINNIKRKISYLTTTISESQANKVKDYITDNPYGIKDIKIINLKYDENIGLKLERDIEYELNDKFI